MTPKEVAAQLERAGFRLLKRGKKHLLYARGKTVIPVAQGTAAHPRAVKSLRALLRRIEREEKGT